MRLFDKMKTIFGTPAYRKGNQTFAAARTAAEAAAAQAALDAAIHPVFTVGAGSVSVSVWAGGGSGGGAGGGGGNSPWPGAGGQAGGLGVMAPGQWVVMSGGNAIVPFSHSGRLKRLKYLPDTLGWRSWTLHSGLLLSPQMGTLWDGPELRCDRWSTDEAVRGVAGIHALRAPEIWRDLVWEYCSWDPHLHSIVGLVERFGRFVLGEDGWRAEWVMIRELLAPDKKTAHILAHNYPEVEIHVEGA